MKHPRVLWTVRRIGSELLAIDSVDTESLFVHCRIRKPNRKSIEAGSKTDQKPNRIRIEYGSKTEAAVSCNALEDNVYFETLLSAVGVLWTKHFAGEYTEN